MYTSMHLVQLFTMWFDVLTKIFSFCTKEISADNRNSIHKSLMLANDFVDSSVFNSAKQHSCYKLEEAWIRYLKEDLKIFLE